MNDLDYETVLSSDPEWIDKRMKESSGVVVVFDDAGYNMDSRSQKKGVSVILPVKDPEPYLETLTKQIFRYLTAQGIPHEILIQREPGLTNAVIEGVKRSQYDLIAVMDADGSHPSLSLIEMYDCFRLNPDVDLVIGSKDIDAGVDLSPMYRKFISKVFRFLARSLLDLDVSDPMSGFVMGKKEWFNLLEPSNDYKFLLQLLCLRPHHLVELPIIFYTRKAGSSKASFKTGLKTFLLIHKLWLKRK